MSIQKFATALAAPLLLASPAFAQLAVTADIGSTGAGMHLVVPMESTLNGRFGINGYSHEGDKSVSAIDYRLKTSLKTVDILFDWYVLNNSPFHLSGGVVYNNNKVEGVGKPLADGTYNIDGYSYEAAWVGTLSGDVHFRRAAPYLGIGWGNPLTSSGKWSFIADLGGFFQGRPRATLSSHGCTVSASVCGNVAKSVAVEQAQFRDDVKSFRVYPVLRAGIAYRF
jgi:hypothetical protein